MAFSETLKFKNIVLLALSLYIIVIYFIYQDNKNNQIENEKIHIEDVLTQIKAIRKYVSNDQKNEVYKLQKEGIVSHHYFSSPLLSSTYSANRVNEYYNELKKEKNLPTIDIRFASPNPRNPKNLATEDENKILDKFRDKKIDKYQTIKKTEKGDVLYIALPTKRLESKCMRCHSTPEAAPRQLVEKYGDMAGFNEKLGSMKALMSIEKPLKKAYDNAFHQTFKTAVYILLATLVFIYFYYNFNKKIYQKNEELEELNENLDLKVQEKTKELDDSKTQLLNVINSSELGYWDWNLKDNTLEVNDIWLNMIGLEKDEFNNNISEFFERIHPDELKEIKPIVKTAFKENKSFTIEFRIQHKNGTFIWIESSGGVIQKNKNNEVIKACGIFRDINSKKENEQKIEEQNKLIHNQAKVTAVGEMLKNISHQWKQPLSAITTIASSVKLTYELGNSLSKKEIVNYSENILSNSNYLAKTINDFSSYFENNIENKETVDLKEVFDKILNLIKDIYVSENIIPVLNVEKNSTIKINENLLIQAILNILNNSHDAFESNNIDTDMRYIFIDLQDKDKHIKINIKDSAGGIKEEALDKIFEPYFTTKHQSIGTGIGLYMTHQIILKHLNGTINAKNEKYNYKNLELNGCNFEIIIPIDD